MPVPSNADHNVPQIGPRKRYIILDKDPIWVYHEMDAGAALNGAHPITASVAAEDLDPTVSAGLAKYTDLTEGGLFSLLANYKKPIVVEAVDNPGSATITIVRSADNAVSRTAPSAPFKVSAGECLKAVGGGNGGKVGFLVREFAVGETL